MSAFTTTVLCLALASAAAAQMEARAAFNPTKTKLKGYQPPLEHVRGGAAALLGRHPDAKGTAACAKACQGTPACEAFSTRRRSSCHLYGAHSTSDAVKVNNSLHYVMEPGCLARLPYSRTCMACTATGKLTLSMEYAGGAASCPLGRCNSQASATVAGNTENKRAVKVQVHDADGGILYSGRVKRGKAFTFTAGAGSVVVTLRGNGKKGKVLSTVRFATGCAEPLYYGDAFGPLRLVGFTGSGRAHATACQACFPKRSSSDFVPAVATAATVTATVAATEVVATTAATTASKGGSPADAISTAPTAAAAANLRTRANCTDLGWRTKSAAHPDTCAASEINGRCTAPRSSAFFGAQQVCASAGARLCTIGELEANVARGTGCRLDDEVVWSSTPCGGGGNFNKFFANTGAPSTRSRVCLSSTLDLASLRCCASSASSPAGKPEPSASDSISKALAQHTAALSKVLSNNPAVLASMSPTPCAELGWPLKAGSHRVCGASKAADGTCYKNGRFSLAAKKCHDMGARLCTIDEIESKVAHGTGCNLDDKLVWTSSSCGENKVLTNLGGGGRGQDTRQCTPLDSTASMRCCASATALPAKFHLQAAWEAAQQELLAAPGKNAQAAEELESALPTFGGGKVVHASARSAKSCQELGWGYAFGNTEVCVQSEIQGTCFKDNTNHVAAEAICKSTGSRLCSITELVNKVTAGTGCALDSTHIWSSSQCGDGRFLTALGGGGGEEVACLPVKDTAASLRCCADTDNSWHRVAPSDGSTAVQDDDDDTEPFPAADDNVVLARVIEPRQAASSSQDPASSLAALVGVVAICVVAIVGTAAYARSRLTRRQASEQSSVADSELQLDWEEYHRVAGPLIETSSNAGSSETRITIV